MLVPGFVCQAWIGRIACLHTFTRKPSIVHRHLESYRGGFERLQDRCLEEIERFSFSSNRSRVFGMEEGEEETRGWTALELLHSMQHAPKSFH